MALSLAWLTGIATVQAGEYDTIAGTLQTCATCHGPNGATPIQPDYPILAGQQLHYLYVQLKDYKAGRRQNEIMSGIAAPLEKDDMLLLAKYFSEQSWPNIGYRAGEEDTRVGLRAINAGQCVACHLGGFEGNSRVPRLAGQNPAYLEKTLADFKYKRRNNSPAKTTLLKSFEDTELVSLARHLGGL